jgi:uncharacterized protein
MNYWIAAFIGMLSGVTSGLFGVGGGIVMVPAMLFLLSPPIRDIKQAIGTSLVIMIPTAIMGSWRHYKPDPAISNIHWQTAFMVIPTAILGSFFGVWLTHHLSADNLKRAFGALLVLVGLRMALFK